MYYRRFVIWFAVLISVYFLFTGLLSLIVNPWRINKTPLSLEVLDEARDITDTLRVGKAALANRGDWQVAVFGSSRIEQTLNPKHAAFGDRKTVNLALAAASLIENIIVANYTLDRNPDLELMLFGIDPGDLHSNQDSRNYTEFYESPFADNNTSIERNISQLIGGRSLIDSVATVSRYASGETPDRSSLGQWIRPNKASHVRDYVKKGFHMGFIDSQSGWHVTTDQLHKKKARMLQDLLIRARRKGIEVHLIIPPQHALKLIHPEINQPNKMCWNEDLQAIAKICENAKKPGVSESGIKLWNFLTFNRYTTEPIPLANSEVQTMNFWADLGHSAPEVIDSVLNHMLNSDNKLSSNNAEICVNLLEGDWNEHCRKWIQSHQNYCESQTENVSWWRAMSENYKD